MMRTFSKVLLTLLCVCAPAVAQTEEKTFWLRNNFWQIKVAPALLGVWGEPSGVKREFVLAAPTASAPEKIADLKKGKDRISWRVPEKDLTVELRLAGTELSVRFESHREQTIEWPSTATDAQTKAIIFPQNEGLYLPVRDTFWLGELEDKECHQSHQITMPFWGVEFDRATVAYLLPNDLRSKLCLRGEGQRITLTVPHSFLARDRFPVYEVKIVLAPPSAIGPALVYRDWLMKAGRHVSLTEKARRNPAVEKLTGAMHAYLWGDGATPDGIRQLHDLGIERAALFYDQDQRNTEKFARTLRAIKVATSLGYLIGPYETFANIQNPQDSDSFTSIYDEALFQTGGVMREDGLRQKGFQGRGYELSSEALKRAPRPFIEERVNAHLRTGANAVFLDVDAFGELFDDYDPQHPMTLAEDRENRLARMRFISETKNLVLGSESAVSWSAPVLAFSHGTQSLQTAAFWNLHRQREVWGRWYPANRPATFFKTIDAPARFATAVYDPRYRLPLFEAVFHDSVITTDFWGASMMKFTNLVETRSLLLQLYNVPSIWNLDQQAIKEYGARIKAMNDFFAPIHRRIGTKPLTRFEWLTADRMVQQTQFADEIELTANFGTQAYKTIPPRCIEARWLKEMRRQQYCPEKP